MNVRPSAVAACALLALPAAASANLFFNGSLNHPGPGPRFVGLPTNWHNLASPGGGGDTASAAGHPLAIGGLQAGLGDLPFPDSPNSGTFVWASGAPEGTSPPFGMRQGINGLIVGETYTISFEYSNLGLYNPQRTIALNVFGQSYASDGSWIVEFAGARIAQTPVEPFAPTSGSQVWRTFSFNFTPTASSGHFNFIPAWNSGSGTRAGMGIDGLSLTLVPAPGSALLLAGAAILLNRRRR